MTRTILLSLRWDGEHLSKNELVERAARATKAVIRQFAHLATLDIQALPDEDGQYVQLVVKTDCGEVEAEQIPKMLKLEFANAGINPNAESDVAGESVQPSGENVCPGCGKAITREAVLCVHCGYSIATGRKMKTTITDNEPEPSERASFPFFPSKVILTGVAVLIVVCAWAFWGSDISDGIERGMSQDEVERIVKPIAIRRSISGTRVIGGPPGASPRVQVDTVEASVIYVNDQYRAVQVSYKKDKVTGVSKVSPNDPFVAGMLYSSAWDCQHKGQYTQAELLYERSLAACLT